MRPGKIIADVDSDSAALQRRIAELEQQVAQLQRRVDQAAHPARGFWTRFEDALRPLSDPGDVMEVAARLVAQQVGASRAGYGEIEPGELLFRVTREWSDPQHARSPAQFQLADFGTQIWTALTGGETVAISDVCAACRTPAREVAVEGSGYRALLMVPLMKGGQLAAGLFLAGREPRAWTEEEIGLAVEVAHRTWSDIQKAKAEAALRESEQRYRATQEHAGIGIAETDQTGRYLQVNEAFCNIVGYSREELVGLTPWDLTLPDDTEADRSRFQQQVDGTLDTYSVEKRFLRKDGSIGWAWVTGSAVRDDHGRFLYAVRVLQDVTEHKNAEAALRDREERLRLAAEVTQLGTWDVNPVTGVREWSAQFRAILGLPKDAAADYQVFASLIHPEDREWVEQYYASMFESTSGGHYDAEFRIRRADDGRERWVRASGRIYFGKSGHAVRAIGTLQDVTGQKRAETALRTSEERYRTLVELSPDAMFVDIDSYIVLANDAALSLLGAKSRDDIEGQSSLKFIMPEYHATVRQRLQKLKEHGGANPPIEQRWRRLDGAPVDVEVSSASVPWGNGRANQVILRDITARKASEEALRYQLNLNRLITDNAAEALFMVDAQGRVTFANPAAERMLGWSREDMLGQDLHGLIHRHGPDHQASQCAMDHVLKSTSTLRDQEDVFLRRDGTPVPVLCSSAPITSTSGPAGAVLVVHDMTERKRADEQQKLLLNELNHRVKNTLATVQSLAMQTLRTAPSAEAFQDAFLARLMALSATHNLLTQTAWERTSLHDVVEVELAPYGGGEPGRVQAQGDPILLPPRVALALGMVLHELATNAAKYGALSRPEGRVELKWDVVAQGQAASQLTITWTERNGPQITVPARRGFGSRLIEQTIRLELDGEIRFDFDPLGLRCRMAIVIAQ